jgi:hypothetical protein
MTSSDLQKVTKNKLAGVLSRDHLSLAPQSIRGLPLRQFVHSWHRDGGLNSICMKCMSVLRTNTDELSLLDSERKHVCGE